MSEFIVPSKKPGLDLRMATSETLFVIHRGREWPIAGLRDAQLMATRMLMQQQFQSDVQLGRVRDAIDQAVAGHQSPAAAMRMFADFARTQGILVPTEHSTARDNFEKMLGPRRRA